MYHDDHLLLRTRKLIKTVPRHLRMEMLLLLSYHRIRSFATTITGDNALCLLYEGNPIEAGTPMQNVQNEIEQGNERFWRSFSRMNIVWIAISLITIIIAAKSTFQAHPAYLHDWHLFAIAALSLVVLGIYFLALFHWTIFKNRVLAWPPPLSLALPFWFGLFIGF